MKSTLKTAYDFEMDKAKMKYAQGRFEACFKHLERAHILGQKFTFAHTMSHYWMLKVGLKIYDRKEVLGQLIRIVAAIVFSKVWVPKGNTGGSNVSAIMSLPIPDDLREYLDD
ncbi:DUF3703 domain-containing protein [Pseudoalteromonas luteoviolacea]|uniref:DUF3703 domain-containing protein n=1 Tax=Pseudoalteromonas luteoviolacea NCIMB 1942 TaxID=1365253 RepID=A0A167GNB0_9GAMM|nr:DUF3703 domain-containing protein [Pseudoalteromonas luteoviolacea]KZN55843.1 hypothetical protein N482_05035 [Pseudoalteromonas luteoviolacea NCIMB 1942]